MNVKAFVGNLKTETEVAEAFFSASNGNMEMLNNMLGTQYQTFEEAKKGIAKNQGGLVEEMSKTLGGKTSTIVGKTKEALKNFVRVFEKPLVDVFSKIESFIDVFSDKLKDFGGSILETFETFSKSEQANQYLQIFKTVGEVAFNGIKAVIDACRPTVEAIFNFIAQHSEEISTIIETLGKIWETVWKTVGKLLEGAWGICEPILSTLVKALAKISGAVEEICNWWNKMTELLKKPIETSINIVKKGASFVSDKLGLSEGKNAFGSGRIARDGTVRTLHEGEKVLTKRETDAYLSGNNSQGINITINGLTVREEADITMIANKLVKKINQSKMVYGGAY